MTKVLIVSDHGLGLNSMLTKEYVDSAPSVWAHKYKTWLTLSKYTVGSSHESYNVCGHAFLLKPLTSDVAKLGQILVNIG